MKIAIKTFFSCASLLVLGLYFRKARVLRFFANIFGLRRVKCRLKVTVFLSESVRMPQFFSGDLPIYFVWFGT